AIKALLLCGLIGGAGVGYVWQKGKISQLSRQILRHEKHLGELQSQNEKLRKQLGLMRSPQFLELRVKELGLGLAAPSPSQVWRLSEPTVEPVSATPPSEPRQYAQKAGTQTVR
ncbi:MAG: hypothetical protein U1F65_09215, partial [Verrucomicrobiota bacterium]